MRSRSNNTARRAASAVLILILFLSRPFGAAAEAAVSDTSAHGTTDYRDMEYQRYDTERFYELKSQAEELCAQEDKKEEVLSVYRQLLEEVDRMDTLYVLSENAHYRDVNNSYYQEEYDWMFECTNTIYDEFLQTVSVILNSSYQDDLIGLEGEEITYYEKYEAMTEEELEMNLREQKLTGEYDQAYLSDAEDRYNTIGRIFLDLVDVRTEMAEFYGYDNYADFAYENIYARDYTTKDIKYLYSYVKAYIVPVYEKLLTRFNSEIFDRLYSYQYGGEEELLELLEPFMGEISEELSEAFSYMGKYHLYDWDVDDKKMGVGYTTYLPQYKAPFTFNASDGSFYDVTTLIHEFGHYNEFYQNGRANYYESDSIDVSEVHSQGLELLFLEYYPELFGEIGEDVKLYTLYSILSGLVDGCLYDEFQYEVYTNPQMDIKEINKCYLRLAAEYGMDYLSYSDDSVYQWMEIPHTFSQPMYYVSYAVSAAAALELWDAALTDRENGIATYLQFVDLGCNTGIRDALSECGLSNVLNEETIQEIAEMVVDELKLGGVRFEEVKKPEKKGSLPEPTRKMVAAVVGIIIIAVFMGIKNKNRYRDDSL